MSRHNRPPTPFQCPECLTRGIQHMRCDCEPSPGQDYTPHEQGYARHDAPCENAMCDVCGWIGTYPDIPVGTPKEWQDAVRGWLQFGVRPAEALWCHWQGLRIDGINPEWSCIEAINRGGEAMIDLVAVLVRADRLHPGDKPLDVVRGICERLDIAERHVDRLTRPSRA